MPIDACDELLAAFRGLLEGFRSGPVAGFLAGLDWSMPRRPLEPRALRCLRHLPRAAEIAGREARPLAALLAARSHLFHWGQTYSAADFGQDFVDNYGWLEVLGTRGHFANDRIAGGLLVLGPGLLYPDHRHVAEEVYLPLTGATEWRMAGEPFRLRGPGEVVHHRSNVDHAMRTGKEPLLALYLWRGGPLAERSTISRPAAAGGC